MLLPQPPGYSPLSSPHTQEISMEETREEETGQVEEVEVEGQVDEVKDVEIDSEPDVSDGPPSDDPEVVTVELSPETGERDSKGLNDDDDEDIEGDDEDIEGESEGPDPAPGPDTPLTPDERAKMREARLHWTRSGNAQAATRLRRALRDGTRPNPQLLNLQAQNPLSPNPTTNVPVPKRQGPGATYKLWADFTRKVTDWDDDVIENSTRDDLILMLQANGIIPVERRNYHAGAKEGSRRGGARNRGKNKTSKTSKTKGK